MKRQVLTNQTRPTLKASNKTNEWLLLARQASGQIVTALPGDSRQAIMFVIFDDHNNDYRVYKQLFNVKQLFGEPK